ncbi:MAG: diacylglycerol kinase family protein, partial [Candidatus Baltobacteraceae bacterium]
MIVNSQSRRGLAGLERIRQVLAELGMETVEASVADASGAAAAMREFRDRIDCVIVGGGDGTVISMIPGLLESKLPLGIIPLGTFNDLARTLEVPLEIEEAAARIAAGNVRTIDIARVNGAYFVNEASIGLSSRIARLQTSQ